MEKIQFNTFSQSFFSPMKLGRVTKRIWTSSKTEMDPEKLGRGKGRPQELNARPGTQKQGKRARPPASVERKAAVPAPAVGWKPSGERADCEACG